MFEYQQTKRFEDIIKNLPFDPKGHLFGDINEEGISPYHREVDLGRLERILDGKKKGEITIRNSSYLTQCYVCGEKVPIATDGKSTYAKNSCQYPDGIPLEFELNVPSGIMVVANDLRPIFDFLGDYDINTRIGCVKTTKKMEEIGCAHAYVGNSCPVIYRTNENQYIIASVVEEDEDLPKFKDHVGGIITDLWWYSIVDYDEFIKRGLKIDKKYVDLIKTKSGVYKFNHFIHLNSFKHDYENTEIFTEIKWVRKPDPIRNYQKEFMSMNFTAEQIIYNSIKNYPTLYNGPDAIRRVADHIFCVLGGGGDWHPNGFVVYDPDIPKDEREVFVPQFDGLHSWYELYDYSNLCCAAGIGREEINLNKSFASLAKNVARCIPIYGMKPWRDDKNPEETIKKQKEIAKKCWGNLLEKYPE